MQWFPVSGFRGVRPVSGASVAPLLPRFATNEGSSYGVCRLLFEIGGKSEVTLKSPAPQAASRARELARAVSDAVIHGQLANPRHSGRREDGH